MVSEIVPLSLTREEKALVREYIDTFNAWDNLSYEDDPLDAFKISEYLCMCDSLRTRFTELYKRLPQVVKDEHLVPRPEHPHRPRYVKRSPSWTRVIEVVW